MKTLRGILATLKNKAEQGKAIVSLPKYQALKLSLLRATTNDPLAPPDPKDITIFLSFGQGPRAAASVAIHALVDRLCSTDSASVSVKCLVLVHHIFRHGSFVLVDQLSNNPSSGGRNCLKLSNFRDDSSSLCWDLSSWIRWYARYLEHEVCTCKMLEPFTCLSGQEVGIVGEEERITTLTNIHLIKEMEYLVGLVEEMCLMPQSLLKGNILVEHIMGMVSEDAMVCMNAMAIRVKEFDYRIECLSYSDSLEVLSVLKRLGGCYHGMVSLFPKTEKDRMWVMSNDLSEKVGMHEELKGEGKCRKGRSHSLRVSKRLLRCDDSFLFSSCRYEGELF